MAECYADAAFYIALLLPGDQHHEDALRLGRRIEGESVVTSEPVLVEVLAFMSSGGARGRDLAVGLVDRLRAHPLTTIIPQTHALFEAGLALYRRRPDKAYSLTDTMSMAICIDRRIEQVLTHDRHFVQEGFEALL